MSFFYAFYFLEIHVAFLFLCSYIAVYHSKIIKFFELKILKNKVLGKVHSKIIKFFELKILKNKVLSKVCLKIINFFELKI